MQQPQIVIGMGQLGRILSEGFLRTGYPVVPILRSQSIETTARKWPEAASVLVAVGEDDLDSVLSRVPDSHLDRVILVQNELRPDQWRQRFAPGPEPSVLVVWFEKKGVKPPHVLLPSVFHGSGRLVRDSDWLERSLQALDIPVRRSADQADLWTQLVIKNLFILALNLVGLKTGGTAGQLLVEHRRELDVVLDELLLIEDRLFSSAGVDGMLQKHDLLRSGLREAILADENHGCKGRSAPRRLERTLGHAETFQLDVPHLRSLRSYLS